MPRRAAPALSVVVCGLLGAGCGGGSSPPATTTTRTTPKLSSHQVAMPDVIGEPLASSEQRLRAIGFALNVTGPRGERVSGTAWVVCRSNPPAGITLPSITRIELIVDRPGRCSPP